MHLITLFWVLNPHQKCFQAKVKTGMSQNTHVANVNKHISTATSNYVTVGSRYLFTVNCKKKDILAKIEILKINDF